MRFALPSGSVSLRTTVVRLTLAAIVTMTAAYAQMAAISGAVKDQSGAAVAGAVVAVTDDATKTKKSKLADANGMYAVADLAAGGYTVEVSAPGFAVFTKKVTVATAPMALEPQGLISIRERPSGVSHVPASDWAKEEREKANRRFTVFIRRATSRVIDQGVAVPILCCHREEANRD